MNDGFYFILFHIFLPSLSRIHSYLPSVFFSSPCWDLADEMQMKRPQCALLAEACRLLAAVCALTGQGAGRNSQGLTIKAGGLTWFNYPKMATIYTHMYCITLFSFEPR
jgi:hypothetical protein